MMCPSCRKDYVISGATRKDDEAAKALGFIDGHQYGVLTAKPHRKQQAAGGGGGGG
jgi:hypothetical protein